MQKAFDLTEVRLLLRRMVASGYVTLEQLDTPSMGWKENAERFRRDYPKYEQPVYRNLLRDDDAPVAVALSEPRDFTPSHGATPLEGHAEPSQPSDAHRPQPDDEEPLPF